MVTTESVFRHRAERGLLLRNRYIDLRGLKVKWRRQSVAQARRDFYGDVQNDVISTEETIISVVLVGVAEMRLIDVWRNNQNTTDHSPDNVAFKGLVKVGLPIQKGDVILFAVNRPDQIGHSAEVVEFPYRIVDVTESVHRTIPSKNIEFVPYY